MAKQKHDLEVYTPTSQESLLNTANCFVNVHTVLRHDTLTSIKDIFSRNSEAIFKLSI